MTKGINMVRQGDVLLREVERLPVGAKKQKPDQGRVILAHGEVTGHLHQLSSAFTTMFATEAGQRFIKAKEGARLTHEEHDAIEIKAGVYEVCQQKEYSPAAIRNVAD